MNWFSLFVIYIPCVIHSAASCNWPAFAGWIGCMIWTLCLYFSSRDYERLNEISDRAVNLASSLIEAWDNLVEQRNELIEELNQKEKEERS